MTAYATTVSWSDDLLGSHLNVELDQAEGGFSLVYGGKDVSVGVLWSSPYRVRSIQTTATTSRKEHPRLVMVPHHSQSDGTLPDPATSPKNVQ